MQKEPPLLQSLAASIHACAQSITAYCDEVHYPQASFEPDAPSTLLPSTAPQHLLDAQETLLESVVQLQHLAFDVSDFLPCQQVYYQQLSALQWLCHFDILSHIPPTMPVTYTSLASLASVPEPLLRRIAPMAITAAFLCSPSPNHLAHTRLSAAFAADPALRDWLLYLASASAPTALKLTEATERWEETKKPEVTAYGLAMGTELGFFEHLKADPGRGKEFAGYMAAVGKSKGVSLDHLINDFDWASLPDGGVVVDVGGSTGHASRTLAQTFPHLRFIVQDTPSTIATALSQQPSPPSDRITYTPHDFFTPQPVRNAAIYLLRAILLAPGNPALVSDSLMCHVQ
ncbi:hypothetical protein JMJ35_006866 [Cladonia borealis]|uniref:O-methyltransferase C-terminal domain-containing protein n=1 Tax=Cladonia borealis TaxID=184061 RepID=A0AA39V3V9_9LECA|nr:hypothetical protein JMJ35_006866 [Cladonia borealis]